METKETDKLKLNLGCGKETKEGFEGVDVQDFGQKYKADLREKWEFKDGEVDEIYSRHLIPCLTKEERTHLFNELGRVLSKEGSAQIIIPAWNNNFGYGHPHFKEPFYEGFLYYLGKEWRETNFPEVKELTCDLEATWGYNMHPNLMVRNQEYQQFALSNYINSAMDLVVTLKQKIK